MFNVGSVQGYLKLNTTGWTTGMGRANASLAGLSRAMVRFGAVTVGSLLLIEREFGRFDKAIRHATSVSEVTEEQFAKMSKMALDASVQWNKSAASTAQAFYYLGSAGLSATEQMQAFNDTIMLSRAMGSELSLTAKGVVDVVKAFGLQFSDTRNIADQLTKTVISSNQHFEDLDKALSYVGTTARFTNNTLADTVAMLGIMADAGIRGSMAGTILRRAFANLMSPTREMQNLIYELGLSIYDTTGRMRPYTEILGQISDALKDSSDEYKNLVFRVLFGVRAIGGQIALFNYGSEAIRKYSDSVRDAGGTTERVAGKQMKAFSEQLGMLWRTIQRTAINIGELLAPSVESLANKLRDGMDAWDGYISKNKEAVTSALKWVAVIGSALAVGVPLMFTVTSLIKQFTVLATVVASPFMILIASLYAFRAVWKNTTDAMHKDVKEMLQAQAYHKFGWGPTFALGGAGAFVGRYLGVPGMVAGGALGMLAGGVQSYRNKRAYQKRYGLGQSNTTSTVKTVTDTPVPEKKIPSFMEEFKKALSDAGNIESMIKTQISEDINSIVEKIGELPGIGEEFTQFMSTLKGLINNFLNPPEVEKALEELPAKIKKSLDPIPPKPPEPASKFRKAWVGAVKDVMDNLGTLRESFVDLLQNVKSGWATTMSDFMNEGGKFKDFIENMFMDVLRAFNGMVAEMLARKFMWKLVGGAIGSGSVRETSFIPGVATHQTITPDAMLEWSTNRLHEGAMNMQKPAVNVIVNNQSSTQISARKSAPQFDGKQWVVNTVLEAYDTDPGVRSRLGGR